MGLRLMLLPLCLLAACSTQAAEKSSAPLEEAASGVHPVSGLEVVPLTVSQNGETHRFRVEVAATPQEQARGLMFRTEMGADEGMIFISQVPQVRSFWMRNTVIPLDIIFIGPDGRIMNIAADTVPYSETPILSDGPAMAVLELNAGTAALLGFGQGAKVEW